MKKIIILVLFFLSILSCNDDTISDSKSPKLIVSNDTISFNNEEIKSLFISTTPKINCDYKVISHPDWVTLDHEEGTLTTNKGIDEIKMESTFSKMAPGVYTGKLEIMSNLGNKSVFLKGFIGDHLLYSLPDTLQFSIGTDKLNLPVKNEGNIALNYNITNSNPYITLSANNGNIDPEQTNYIAVSINKDGFPNGKSYTKLYLNINSKLDSVVISVDNYKESKIKLSSDVVDAEYSKNKDKLVYVSSYPSQVNIFNTSTETLESISLPNIPTCVSVSQDGETAVVGHDGSITYVNLTTKSIINTYSVSCSATDIVLGNNKWAYVFPKVDQWEYIRCVNLNLNTDNEQQQTGYQIYAGTKGKMHPSGKSIYGADNGLSPSDIEKYDIQNGTAVNLYDSPYHGDYPMNGDLWFSEDGQRIFTRGKTVLKTSDSQSLDMKYNGTINLNPSGSQISWLDHSSNKGNLYIIASGGDYWTPKNISSIFVYNSSNLTYKSNLELEKFMVPNNGNATYFDAEPFFVFSNSTGNQIYVLIKATGAGLENEWAIQKIGI